MATLTIDSMQLELLVEGRSRHEPLQFRDPHFGYVLENHVLPHHLDRCVDLSPGKSQTSHDFFGHYRTNTIVRVKTNSPRLIDGCGAGFRDIVKQYGENERHRNFFRKELQHQSRVLKNVTFGVKLLWLLTALHRVDLRQNGTH